MSRSARDTIFGAIDGSDAPAAPDRSSIDSEAQALLADPDGMRPPRTADDVVKAFIERVRGPKVAATATRIPSLSQLPNTVSDLLSARGLPSTITLQPTSVLTSLDWASGGMALDAVLDDGVAVAHALWGIAETGSLVVHSDTDSPVLLHFLPAISIVAVPADRLLWHLEDYAAAMRNSSMPAPRNACLITGASGTTDIEGRLVTGAHGPGELQVLVYEQP